MSQKHTDRYRTRLATVDDFPDLRSRAGLASSFVAPPESRNKASVPWSPPSNPADPVNNLRLASPGRNHNRRDSNNKTTTRIQQLPE